MNVLVFNVGSTTLKYACIDTVSGERVATGIVDRIGQAGGDATDHMSAAKIVLERLTGSKTSFSAIGHRIVHGGAKFKQPTRVTAEVLHELKKIDSLAPLHNPSARLVVESLVDIDTPQLLVFDTAYFATLPEAAWRYALPNSLLEKYGVRRYGFHGTSHQYVTKQALDFLGGISDGGVSDGGVSDGGVSDGGVSDGGVSDGHESSGEIANKRIITLHLGGGASVTASIGGVAIDTSMGMTPLEGLVMATRCGDIDPAIPLFLIREAGMSADEVDRLLNKQSGLVGMCGESDMRAVLQRSDEGDANASLALDIYVRKIIKTIGSYFAILGSLDALVFTAGIGEHSAAIRERVVQPLAHLGIAIDPMANQSCTGKIHDLTAGDVRVLVIPTDEELAIARQIVV